MPRRPSLRANTGLPQCADVASSPVQLRSLARTLKQPNLTDVPHRSLIKHRPIHSGAQPTTGSLAKHGVSSGAESQRCGIADVAPSESKWCGTGRTDTS